jgi:ABC-type molybdenum transport system ATPase subunit/photorepair protein PhrA
MRRQYGYVALGGIAPRIQDCVLQIPLGDLFVAPQAEANAPSQTQFVVIDRQGYQAVRAGNLALVGLDELKAVPRSVILGAPGAGKTTLLRWLVAETLQSLDMSDGCRTINTRCCSSSG